MDQILLLHDDGPCSFGAEPHQLQDLGIDLILNVFRVLLGILGLMIADPAEAVSKAELGHVGLPHLVSLVEVVTCPCGDLPEKDLL